MTRERNDSGLTIDAVADLLNVSSAYVVDLLDRRELPCHVSEGERRITAADLLRFKRRDDVERRRVLDELTSEAERYGLGYRGAQWLVRTARVP